MKQLLALILSVLALVSASSASAFPALCTAPMPGMVMSPAAATTTVKHHDAKGSCCDDMPKGCAEACGVVSIVALPDAPIGFARAFVPKSKNPLTKPEQLLVGFDPPSLDRPPRLTV